MGEWKPKYPKDEHVGAPKYQYQYHEESPAESYHDESPSSPAYPKYYSYTHQQKAYKKVKKVKHVYDPGYDMPHGCPPIVCPPQYCIRDCYIPREVPVVHPIVNVNRHVIVNVPRHYYQPMTQNVVVDPGCPGKSCRPKGHY
jgi:hypothetical protein